MTNLTQLSDAKIFSSIAVVKKNLLGYEQVCISLPFLIFGATSPHSASSMTKIYNEPQLTHATLPKI